MVGEFPRNDLERLLDFRPAGLAETFQRRSDLLDFVAQSVALFFAQLKDFLAFTRRVRGTVEGCGVDRLQFLGIGGKAEVGAEGGRDGLNVPVQSVEGRNCGDTRSDDGFPRVLEPLSSRGLVHLGTRMRLTQPVGLGAVLAQLRLGFVSPALNRG